MRRLLSALAAACLLATLAPSGAAALSWTFATQNPVGDQPRDILFGEYEAEDKGQDWIVANSANDNVQWGLSNGDGTFRGQDACNTGPTFGVEGGPAALASGSWKIQTVGDGLVAAGFDEPVVTTLAQNNVFGGCGFIQEFPTGRPFPAVGLSGLAVGDLNGDGNDDSVVTDFSMDVSFVSLQSEFGGFGNFNGFVGGDGPRGPALADFNHDHKLDYAVAEGAPEKIGLALGNGDGTFPAPALVSPALEAPLAVEPIEANGDGNLDLLVTELEGVSLLLGDGKGGFGAPARISEGAGPARLQVGDVNGDGREDVLIAYQGIAGSVAIALGQGNGTFVPVPVADSHIGEPMAFGVADFRGDGSRDLAVVNNGNPGSVTVLLGVPQIVVPGAPVAFGGQRVGVTSPTRTITIDDPGAGTLHFGKPTLSGADAGQFEIVGENCTAGVLPSHSCEVKVAFAPTSAGEKTAAVVLPNNTAGSPDSVSLKGTGEISVVDFNPPAIAFGERNTHTASAAQTIVVKNTGGADLFVSSVALTGADASQFQLDHQTCNEHPIPPEGTCQVAVEFAPLSAGEKHAAVTLTDDAPTLGSTQSAALSGTGTEAGLSVSPGALEFGGLDVGVGDTRSLLVTNSGDGPLEVEAVTVGGANPQDFVVAGDGCAAGTVAPGGTCTVSVEFSPTADGARSGSLRLESNAAGGAVHVPLQGSGLLRSVVVAPATLEFGPQRPGAAEARQAVTVANVADGAVHVGSVGVAGPQAGAFAIESQGCTGTPLPAGQSCTIVVGFDPGAVGPAQARLEIADDASGGPHAVPLAGTGVQSAATISRRSLDFGSKPVGRAGGVRSLIVRNTGTAPLDIRAAELGGGGRRSFRVKLGPCAAPVPAGGSCVLKVSFKPRSTGTIRARLTLVDDAPGGAAVTLAGRGAAPRG